ncbi:unnamed protein product (macronuclear) [Paramecium tetraurelia]|uniref:Uncharacterized protein n=1 Tax=Paramecium tetraurelia TaxID=5888 RepID=A0DM79_PARTE|nr:uncharacterized protein GSPATT00018364001 [Paramecium tetraurelia]CAK84146.1 unnamed protein product [Paramecium tetraurelia]|eukprot:XP_001451543.1 hypothetical protein (macronuclear) [Paramecium tetraurelia strain d4-2]
MKIYIQSPVFQRFIFNNQCQRNKLQMPLSQDKIEKPSPIIKFKPNRRRKQTQNTIEPRGLSLSISRETQRTFFKESIQNRAVPPDQFQSMIKEIQVGNSMQVINKLEQGPFTKKSYLILGIAYKQLNQFDKARYWFNKCLSEHPNYLDGYIQSAVLEFKALKYHDSLKLIEQALLYSPNDKQALQYKARCHSALKQHQKALEIYEKLNNTDFLGRSRHCLSLIKCNYFDKALIKIDTILLQDCENADALFLKGIIYFKKKNFIESQIYIEQAIQISTSHQLSAKAISYIVKSKICLMDFYEAQLHLSRAEQLKKNFKCISKLKPFVNGTVKLMKRQYAQGLQMIKDLKPISKFLQPIYYKFLAYAQFCTSDYASALKSYELIYQIERGQLYNKYVAEALVLIEKCQYEPSVRLLDKAIEIFPNKLEPYYYKCSICLLNKLFDGVQECEQLLDLAFSKQGKQPNIFFAKALMKSYKRRYTSALKDIEKAIDKSEDSISDHFYIRGILHAQSMRLKEAIKDFTTAIHFNKEHSESYLERAKCYQIKGNTAQSFGDMNKYIKYNNSEEIHYWSGSLLFHNNAYEEALKAFNDAKQTNQILILKLKCEIKLQQIDKACIISNQITQQNVREPKYKIDSQMLTYIKQILDTTQNKKSCETVQFPNVDQKDVGLIFQTQDVLLFKASSMIYQRRYNEAIMILQQLEHYWLNSQKDRLNSISSQQDADSEKSENLSNEMILKSERIVQHIIGIKYNMAIIYLLIQQSANAKMKVEDIRDQVGNVVSDELDYLKLLIQNQIDKKSTPVFCKPVLTFLMNEKSLFNGFPALKIQMHGSAVFECKLSLNFPDIQPPNICPEFKKEFLLMIKPNLIENKPEAPWLQRTSEQILILTQNQLNDDLDITTDDEEESNEKRRKKRQVQNLEIDENVQKRLDQLIKKL